MGKARIYHTPQFSLPQQGDCGLNKNRYIAFLKKSDRPPQMSKSEKENNVRYFSRNKKRPKRISVSVLEVKTNRTAATADGFVVVVLQ